MENIGVILPYDREDDGFIKSLFKRFRYENLLLEEYGLNFVIVHDNQNCTKIFNKNRVDKIVIMTDCKIERCDFEILNGDSVFKSMIPQYVRKLAKSFRDGCAVTIVDKGLDADTENIVEKLCNVCKNVSLNTHYRDAGEKLADRLLGKYGIILDIIDDDAVICSDVAVVIEDCGNPYSEKCVVIDKNLKESSERRINDFYIPFRVKPPLGMSNFVFAECLDAIDKKDVDIR